ncbi:cytochrome p450, partial [Moniliophthora roreri]
QDRDGQPYSSYISISSLVYCFPWIILLEKNISVAFHLVKMTFQLWFNVDVLALFSDWHGSKYGTIQTNVATAMYSERI